MASVNLTCTACAADAPCARCRSIARALRAAGHAITQSSRYDALRAATVGAYGFDACVLPVAPHEHAIVDAAGVLLGRARVALVVESGAPVQASIPKEFAVIEAGDWQQEAFPTDWVTTAVAAPPLDAAETHAFETVSVPPSDLDSARRRLKSVARRAQRDLGAAGFPEEAKLDLLATLEDEIAWAKMSGACFGMALIHLARKTAAARTADADRLLSLFRQHVESVVRASDIIAHGSDSQLVIIADASLNETNIATSRIKKALRKAIKQAGSDHALSTSLGRVTLGAAVYPTHGTTRAALLARATASATQVS